MSRRNYNSKISDCTPILISGSLVYDHIMNFPDSFKNHIIPDQIHILNVCFVVNKLERSWGGTAGNIAFSMKLLGGAPLIISVLGSDGEAYLKHFRKLGIETSSIAQDKSQLTASAYITTDINDNQVIAFFNGPLDKAGDKHLREIKKPIKLALISPTHKDIMIQHMKECRELGIRVVFDPGQQITAFEPLELQQMIEQSYAVIGNDYEMKLLRDKSGWGTEKILESVELIITTLGEKGSMITTRNEIIEVPSCLPRLLNDPTGAGDAYRAGFFVGFEQGRDLLTCARMGSVAASYAIETYGAQAHTFTKIEFCDRFSKTYGDSLNI